VFNWLGIVHNTRRKLKGIIMSDWLNAILFGVGLVALVLGLSSIIMGLMSAKTGSSGLQEKIEYGYLGVSGLVVFLVVGYALM
jgi:hypothetical protein